MFITCGDFVKMLDLPQQGFDIEGGDCQFVLPFVPREEVSAFSLLELTPSDSRM